MSYDDARLAAALATGLVENETFVISTTHLIERDAIIRNCTFRGRAHEPFFFRPDDSVKVEITGCMFHGDYPDEMTPLYDLLEESHGRPEA